MNCFGAKGGAGVWQAIINQIPPHDLFIEAFAGSATVSRLKRPAVATIVIDSDAAVCQELELEFARRPLPGQFLRLRPGFTVVCADAISWLHKHRKELTARSVVYCDPPYLFAVRSSHRRQRFGHEFGDEWLHCKLLTELRRLPRGVCCLISGYRHELYDRLLSGWRRVDYPAQTRGGKRIESLWCNFPEATELHDPRFVGANFRARQNLKRKTARWQRRIAAMSPVERSVVLAAVIAANAAADRSAGRLACPDARQRVQDRDSAKPLAAALARPENCGQTVSGAVHFSQRPGSNPASERQDRAPVVPAPASAPDREQLRLPALEPG